MSLIRGSFCEKGTDLFFTYNERAKKYREWIKGTIPEGEWDRIRQAVQRGQLTGSKRFVDEIALKIERRIELREQGRPKKNQK